MRHCILNYAGLCKEHFHLSFLCHGQQLTLMLGILDAMPSAQYTSYFLGYPTETLNSRSSPKPTSSSSLREWHHQPICHLRQKPGYFITFPFSPVSHMQLLAESCSFCLTIICDTDLFCVHHCHSQASLPPSYTKSNQVHLIFTKNLLKGIWPHFHPSSKLCALHCL